MRSKASLALILIVLMVAPLWAKGPNGPSSTSSLTDVEKANLLYLFEEEKLAHDIYVEMYNAWGAYIFDNISKSEQRHMDAVANLILKYGLDKDALYESQFDNPPGKFNNQELQAIYDGDDENPGLLERGLESLTSALEVGVDIEEMDIVDINKMQGETVKIDIQRVLENLLAGSENHLKAFNTQLGITP